MVSYQNCLERVTIIAVAILADKKAGRKQTHSLAPL